MIKKPQDTILLYIGMCAALLPALMLRDFTPGNELRYLSIADEALSNHTFFAFTNHGSPYADKPPLYLWIVMLCRWLMGEHRLWLLSLFSLLPAIGIAHTMDRWIVREVGEESRSTARLMLLTSGLFIGAAIILRMDMLMCLFIVLSLRQFWEMWDEGDNSRRAAWLFPLYLFLGVFTKGPMGLLIPLCGTILFLIVSKRIAIFFHYWGLRTWSILVLCCLLWFVAVYAEGGADYLQNLLVHQTVDRAVNSFHHNEPVYYYIICYWYSLAPWSLLTVSVLIASARRHLAVSNLQRFFLSVSISALILLSGISSKIEIYMLPVIPFLIYSTAIFLPRLRDNILVHISLEIPAALFAMSLPALFIATSMTEIPFLNGKAIIIAAAILTLTGIHSLYLICNRKRRSDVAATIRSMATGLIVAIFTGSWAMPDINTETGYGSLCDKALEVSMKYGITDFRTWRISRAENMDVYLHRPIQVIDTENTPISGDGKPYLLMTRRCDIDSFIGHETFTVGQHAIVVCR